MQLDVGNYACALHSAVRLVLKKNSAVIEFIERIYRRGKNVY